MPQPANREDIEEIRSLAVQKLSVLLDRCDASESEVLLSVTMREIAKDMGVDLGPVMVTVRDVRDLDQLQVWGPVAPVHLVATSDFVRMRSGLANLAANHMVASIFVYDRTEAVEEFARENRNVPVFVVNSLDQANAIAGDLRLRRSETISGAINGGECVAPG